MGEFDLELALSKDEDGDEDVVVPVTSLWPDDPDPGVAPDPVVTMPPPDPADEGELGDEVLLLLLVLSAAFSTDK